MKQAKFAPNTMQAMLDEGSEQLASIGRRAQTLAAALAEEQEAHSLTKAALADRTTELEELKKPTPPDDGPTQDGRSAD